MTAAPTDLRVEHLVEPLGITIARPRLSWRLPDDSREQHAYRVRAGDWDSGRVGGDRSILVPYAGPEPSSGQRVEWAVKVWTDRGESAWSAPSWWEVGLLEPADWTARWIEPDERGGPDAAVQRPGHLLRHEFTVDAPVASARLYATAHGIYEPFLNGRRVGDVELAPGSTCYWTNLHVQTHDVTDLLAQGGNVIGAVLSDGWFRGENGGLRVANAFGGRVALLAQLVLRHTDGSVEHVGTGRDWTSAHGAIVGADLMRGQILDLRREPRGWSHPGGSGDGWRPVVEADHDLTRLRSSPAPPVRSIEELRPASISRPGPDGRQVVDLGHNINGWVRLTDLGPEGTTVTLTHGEALDPSGDVTQDHVTMSIWPEDAPFQVDRVTSAGEPDDVFEPRHVTHGFRYVRVEGHPGQLAADDITGVVVHTDLRRTGWFGCSDERLDRLHDAAVWSFRGNACDVPTDCPTRERSAWTGDWELFVPTAAFLYDVAGFTTKWLDDLAADQWPDGAVPHVTPAPERPGGPRYLGELAPAGSAGWGDAAVIVPWEMYRAYGDEDLLEQQWPSMVAWVEYAARAAREHRHDDRAAARPSPAAHETFLWDTGFHWGEWLEPGSDEAEAWEDWARRDKADVATAYLQRSASLLARIAGVLAHDDDAARYEELAADVQHAWQAEFVDPDGAITPATQANHVRALAFGLVPDELRPATVEALVKLIRAAGTHLGTGFLATPYLLPVLADHGEVDLAYELLLQDTPPSWLTMIDRGATTIWEDWEGIDDDGVPHRSLNHYSKGAVVSFLHTHTCGIRLLDDGPAYRRFRVQPMPGGGLTRASAAHESPYGRIESSWRTSGDGLEFEVVVPPGTTAEVVLPDGRALEAGPGRATYVAGRP
ncbi:MAG TPA: family 78 glycoside hydrolase catalytic domain [Nitriliruptorales bacterium]